MLSAGVAMKYYTEIELDLSCKRVIEIFDNPDNMQHWMQGLISFEHESGERGYPGAVSKFVFKRGSGEIVIKETIEVRDELKEFTGIYTTDGVWNRSQNLFTELGPEKTLWRQNNEFRCEGLMMKFMTTFLPFMFTREGKSQMKSFKAFAEGLG